MNAKFQHSMVGVTLNTNLKHHLDIQLRKYNKLQNL